MTPREKKEFKEKSQEIAEREVEFCREHKEVALSYERICWKCVKEGRG